MANELTWFKIKDSTVSNIDDRIEIMVGENLNAQGNLVVERMLPPYSDFMMITGLSKEGKYNFTYIDTIIKGDVAIMPVDVDNSASFDNPSDITLKIVESSEIPGIENSLKELIEDPINDTIKSYISEYGMSATEDKIKEIINGKLDEIKEDNSEDDK